jgi:hypothetical protein
VFASSAKLSNTALLANIDDFGLSPPPDAPNECLKPDKPPPPPPPIIGNLMAPGGWNEEGVPPRPLPPPRVPRRTPKLCRIRPVPPRAREAPVVNRLNNVIDKKKKIYIFFINKKHTPTPAQIKRIVITVVVVIISIPSYKK